MMDKLLQHPGWLKLFSVALAILLWAMVLPTYMAETSRLFDIPLTVLPHPTYQVLDGPRDRQTVQVRADGKNLVLSRLKREQFTAVVDMGRVTEPGKPTALEVKVTGPDRQGVQYIVSPPQVMVTLIQTITRQYPVEIEPAPAGVLMLGGREYRYTATPQPEPTAITGQSDILALVRAVKVTLDSGDLQPANALITKTGVPVDAAGEPVEKLDRPEVSVRLTWEEMPPGKLFRVEAITKGSVPDGYVVSDIEVEPTTVSVRAVKVDGLLPEREVVETAPIDLGERTESFTTTVRLVAPGDTTLGIQTVNVRVRIAETMVEKVLKQLPITVRNLAIDSQVALGVSEASVRIKGPYSVMTGIDASAIELFVDVEGRGDGRHLLPVRLAAWPTGVTEIDMDPALVEAVIMIE
jgi:YbbR domain-containing protein